MTGVQTCALPILLRYRTRDITTLLPEPCECGRTIRRMRRISRRSDDMFIIRGVNVFPSQVETALLEVEGTLPHYQIILTREKDLDMVEVQVEVTPEVFSDTIGAMENVRKMLGHSIERTLGIRVKQDLAILADKRIRFDEQLVSFRQRAQDAFCPGGEIWIGRLV